MAFALVKSVEKVLKKPVFVILLIVLVAAFLRVHKLEDIPPGMHGDEAYQGLKAQGLLDDIASGNFNRDWLYAYTSDTWGAPLPGVTFITAALFFLFERS